MRRATGQSLRCVSSAVCRPCLPFIFTRRWHYVYKGILLGTPNREPQEYTRNVMEYKDPGRYIPIIYLLHSWGSRFGVPSKVPLVYAWALSSPIACTFYKEEVYALVERMWISMGSRTCRFSRITLTCRLVLPPKGSQNLMLPSRVYRSCLIRISVGIRRRTSYWRRQELT